MTRPGLRLEQFFTIAASVLRTATTASNEAWRLAAANASGVMWVLAFVFGPVAMLTGHHSLVDHFAVTIGAVQIPGGFIMTAVAVFAKGGTIASRRSRAIRNVPTEPRALAGSATPSTIGEQHDER